MALKVIQPGQIIDTSPKTRADLARMAQALFSGGPVRTIGGGINSAANKIASAFTQRQMRAAEEAKRQSVAATMQDAFKAGREGIPGWNTPDALYTDPITGLQSSDQPSPKHRPDVAPGSEVIAPIKPGLEAMAAALSGNPYTATMANQMQQQAMIDRIEQKRAAEAARQKRIQEIQDRAYDLRTGQEEENRKFRMGQLEADRTERFEREKLGIQQENEMARIRERGQYKSGGLALTLPDGTQLQLGGPQQGAGGAQLTPTGPAPALTEEPDEITGPAPASDSITLGNGRVVPAGVATFDGGKTGSGDDEVEFGLKLKRPPVGTAVKLSTPLIKAIVEDERLIKNQIERMRQIEADFDPELMGGQANLKGGILGLLDYWDQLPEDQVRYLDDYVNNKTNIMRNLSQTLKEMSGAAVTQQEFDRIKEYTINPKNGPRTALQKLKNGLAALESISFRNQLTLAQGQELSNVNTNIPLSFRGADGKRRWLGDWLRVKREQLREMGRPQNDAMLVRAWEAGVALAKKRGGTVDG